jgi:hypothetical protein
MPTPMIRSRRPLTVVVVHPRQVRDFAKAAGQQAKTGRLDAALIHSLTQQSPVICRESDVTRRRMRGARHRKPPIPCRPDATGLGPTIASTSLVSRAH